MTFPFRLLPRALWILTLGLFFVVAPPKTRAQIRVPVANPNTTVQLLLDRQEAKPGSTVWAVLRLRMNPNWHSYWRFSGDSGTATKIQWQLPQGLEAGSIQWPAPEKLIEEGLTTLVYQGQADLVIPLTVTAQASVGVQKLEAKVSWQECFKECLRQSATVQAEFTVGTMDRDSSQATEIATARQRIPRIQNPFDATASWIGSESNNERPLVLNLPGSADFFPYEHAEYDVSAGSESLPNAPATRSLIQKKVSKTGASWPTEVRGLWVQKSPGAAAMEVTIPILANPSVAQTIPPHPPSTAPSTTISSEEPRSLPWILGLAFLGGLILNIMPCVLPVIALKILSFVKQGGTQPGRVRFLGLVYTAGVLASFTVLALLIIAVQSTGKTASWGMQFQNPVFLVSITTLVTLVALNLFGIFEVTLNPQAMGAASQLASKGGATGAFFNGVFTTVLATPCTAPFLGAALGFAFGQPPAILILIFLSAGIGLATPYLLLSIQPAWLRFLPKPGNWMVNFKVAMGFPMLATAFWLLTLAPDHFGEGGVFWMGLFLICISLAAWVLGHFIQTGEGNRTWSWAVIALVLLGSYTLILESELKWRSPPPIQAAGMGIAKPGEIRWQPWSEKAIAQAREQGHPVLVDFTAKWCATCRVNEKVAIDVAAVRERVDALNVITLKGDFTREDPVIAEELRKFGRSGVPLVLVYPKNPALPPRILPSTLTPGIVLEALEWASRSP